MYREIFFIFFCHDVKANIDRPAIPVIEVFEALGKTVGLGQASNPDYKRNLQPIRYTFEKKDIINCKLEKKVLITEIGFSKMPVKSCTEMIERMRYDNSYTPKNILYLEYLPVNCTPQNIKGFLYGCN